MDSTRQASAVDDASSSTDGQEPVSQKHIAERLGLSTATVSRSLRNDQSIRATTRARVFRAAQELGYRIPEARRGSVRSRRIKTLQLVVGSATGLGPAGDEIIAGISEAASAHDAQLSVFVSPVQSQGSLAGDFEPPAIRAGLVDGVILLHSFPTDVAEGLARRLPVVSMVHRYDRLPIDCVDTDERLAVRDLYSFLQQAGHRRIGFVKFGDDSKSWEASRLSGFREAALQAEQDAVGAPVLTLKTDMAASQQVAHEIKQRRHDGVTAWICVCDPVAYQLCMDLRGLGLSIPDDIVVAGYDGLQAPPGESQIPTIRVPYRDLGGAAVRRIAHRIESPMSRIRDILLRHDLVPGYLQSNGSANGLSGAAIPPMDRDNAAEMSG